MAGAGGALMIVSLFLPWASAGGVDRSGFELLTTTDVFLVIAGLVAIAAAITGGRIGLFRPDLSLNAAADLLGLVATTLIAWLLLVDFPDGAGREVGVFLALVAAVVVACGVGDYAPLRGASWFPSLGSDRNGPSRR
jgi:hypothetical protein